MSVEKTLHAVEDEATLAMANPGASARRVVDTMANDPSDGFLSVDGISKHYDGVYALQGVNLQIRRGEVHALVGENGAGKSTLGKVIAGVVRPDSGQIRLMGQRVTIATPMDARCLGIGIVFQELDLFPHLSVAENIAIGNVNLERRGWVNFRQLDEFCRPFLQRVVLQCDGRTVLGELAIGQMQLVAVARALSMDARLIVMDEPTSSLADDSVENLFQIIRQLKASGVSILYVSHKMKEIFQIADRISVLRDGKYIGTRQAGKTDMDEIITMMVGREIQSRPRAARNLGDQPILSVRGLTTRRLSEITFDLRVGEVLGVAGLVGAGRSELGAAMFGLDRILKGTVHLEGRAIAPRSPREAMQCGLGLLPEDRKLQGLMMRLSVRANSSMTVLDRLQKCGFIRGGAELASIQAVQKRTRLKSASYEAPVSSLSGGNQQKVLLAKWMLVDPKVIFLDDPTRGIDVAAKQDVYDLIAELAAKGKGVVFVSSELTEMLTCCDRILVLHEGRRVGLLQAAQTNQEEIMALAMGSVVPDKE